MNSEQLAQRDEKIVAAWEMASVIVSVLITSWVVVPLAGSNRLGSVVPALLAIAFRSYSQPLLILTAVPFGFFGAILGHLLLGYDISIMSMLGFLAAAQAALATPSWKADRWAPSPAITAARALSTRGRGRSRTVSQGRGWLATRTRNPAATRRRASRSARLASRCARSAAAAAARGTKAASRSARSPAV